MVVSRDRSIVAILIILLQELITLPATTHKPPSRLSLSDACGGGSSTRLGSLSSKGGNPAMPF